MTRDKDISADWCIHYDHYSPEDEGRREALLALGNGYLVSRASSFEAHDDGIHYPGTYKVGCYNRLVSHIDEQKVENESLVNLPNWLSLTFRVDTGNWFSIDKVEILDYHQILNMKEAVLKREILFRDDQGRLTKLLERRFVSMDQPHLLAVEINLTALNWTGILEVKSALDGNVANNNVKRYTPFNRRHLEPLYTSQPNRDTILLKNRTKTSGVEIAVAAKTTLMIESRKSNGSRETNLAKDRIEDVLQTNVRKGETITIEKFASLYTSRDLAIGECGEAAVKALERAGSFDQLLKEHKICWDQIWTRFNMHVANKDQLFKLRLHYFQIIQNLSFHTVDLDVGMSPSGWQGEEYHGQIFWDELFVFPFLTFRFPTIARALLLYRYRRLREAKMMAKEQGYQGAMFPWRSASTGKEETPSLQYNLLSERWMKDNTYLQRHINAIIAFNVYQYYQITDDQMFLLDYGAELILEIARFWASIARLNPVFDRYEIHGVVGPDEYHTEYVDKNKVEDIRPGINNNSYTNILASWTLRLACRIWDQLSFEVRENFAKKLAIDKEELTRWKNISKKMRLIFHLDGVLSPFEGFEALQEFDIEEFRKVHGNQRIDWTMEAIGDTVEKYKISKQADTSLLLYLFTPSELIELIEYMGYEVNPDILKRTIRYDIDHTAHESTLSRIVHAGALSQLNIKASWEFFRKAQSTDLIPGKDKGVTEGIHIGAMGGTLSVFQQHYMGIKASTDYLEINPSLPEDLGKVSVKLYYQGVEIQCEAIANQVTLHSPANNSKEVNIKNKNNLKILKGGSSVVFD